MRIKICGLFRDDDIDYVNEAMPDYTGFVFAQSRRQVSPEPGGVAAAMVCVKLVKKVKELTISS